jgi:hypothetical protein
MTFEQCQDCFDKGCPSPTPSPTCTPSPTPSVVCDPDHDTDDECVEHNMTFDQCQSCFDDGYAKKKGPKPPKPDAKKLQDMKKAYDAKKKKAYNDKKKAYDKAHK